MEHLFEQTQKLIHRYGDGGYQLARAKILQDKKIKPPVKQATKYFIGECWINRQHPALLSLACQAVGGSASATDNISAALVMLTGAADIHDDILDKSKTKGTKPTPYGRFGIDTTLLAGDIVLLKSQTVLSQACEAFTPERRQIIRQLIEESFIEIGCAVAKERKLGGKLQVKPSEYLSIIEAKGAVSDAFARVGAIVGGGTLNEVDVLGHFGRSLGILMAVRNEFVDMRDYRELSHRTKYETVPLPVLYALENASIRQQVIGLLKSRINKTSTEKIAELSLGLRKVQNLIEKMKLTATEEKKAIQGLKTESSLKLLLDLSVANF